MGFPPSGAEDLHKLLLEPMGFNVTLSRVKRDGHALSLAQDRDHTGAHVRGNCPLQRADIDVARRDPAGLIDGDNRFIARAYVGDRWCWLLALWLVLCHRAASLWQCSTLLLPKLNSEDDKQE